MKNRLPKEVEDIIKQDPIKTYYYVISTFDKRDPEWEWIIMKDPYAAVQYAITMLQDRWLIAEPIIMKDPSAACEYAEGMMGGRWPKAEKYIRQNAFVWEKYEEIIRGKKMKIKSVDKLLKMSELERVNHLYHYALYIGKRLDPIYEEMIKSNPLGACRYAIDIIGKRWKEAEPYIMKDEVAACAYAINIIKKRWPEAEPVIRKHKLTWMIYHDVLIDTSKKKEIQEILQFNLKGKS